MTKKRRGKSEIVKLKKRLNRIQGQVASVHRMIDDSRYCVDIINVIKASQAALKGLENQILTSHLRECVHEAFTTRKKSLIKKRIKEITRLI